MRLANVTHGHSLGKKLVLRMIRLASRMEAPDVVKTLFYRPAFFGDPFSRFLQSVMRGPSYWTVGERELFATYTSHLEACHFWTKAHGAVASTELGKDTVEAALRDPDTAPLRAPVKAMLAFLTKMVREPDNLTAADAKRVRAEGAPDEALRTAIYICTGFSTITRLADTFEFDIPPAEGFLAGAKMLLRRGYAKL